MRIPMPEETHTINTKNKSKEKRRRRKERKEKNICLKLLGGNANSLVQKFESLENVLSVEKPSVVFLQETKLGRAHRIRTPTSKKYTWYELHRTLKAEKGEKGGGIAIGVINSLQPSWISEGDDDIEAITVEIWLSGFPVRLVCAYGPQEYDSKQRKEGLLRLRMHNPREQVLSLKWMVTCGQVLKL